MNKNKLALLALVAALPVVVFACGGDDTAATGPQNKPDASQPDTSSTTTPETGTPDAGGDSSKVNPCSTGLVFDNTAISSWPNVPVVN